MPVDKEGTPIWLDGDVHYAYIIISKDDTCVRIFKKGEYMPDCTNDIYVGYGKDDEDAVNSALLNAFSYYRRILWCYRPRYIRKRCNRRIFNA